MRSSNRPTTTSRVSLNSPDTAKAVILVSKLLAATAVLSWVVLLGRGMREPASLCPDGFDNHEPRCCAPGQRLSETGTCEGTPRSCPAPTVLQTKPTPGCVQENRKVRIEAGELTVGPTDWDTSDVGNAHTVLVLPFLLDSLEVSVARYQECIEAEVCSGGGDWEEPGMPVTSVSVAEASAFCSFAGGQLPTPVQWTFAAMGTDQRRYPWGAHGLVCRRAVYGLSDGPCGEGAISPELGGMRPDGVTPDGIYDLSGNVAEWTIDETGRTVVKGGSFRSKSAADLKNLGQQGSEAAPDVGFRCAYPIAGIAEAMAHTATSK